MDLFNQPNRKDYTQEEYLNYSNSMIIGLLHSIMFIAYAFCISFLYLFTKSKTIALLMVGAYVLDSIFKIKKIREKPEKWSLKI